MMVDSIRLKDFRFLQRIADLRTLSGAAAEFGVTQPAASRWLRELESLLRGHLFTRDRLTGMTLTALGELVVERGRALLLDVSSLGHDIDAMKEGRGGRLQLGVIPYVPARLLQQLVTELVGAHAMTVTMIEGATEPLLEGLRMQRLHAVIGRCSPLAPDAELRQEVLFRQKACVLVSEASPLPAESPARMRALTKLRWISPPVDSPTWHAIVASWPTSTVSLPRPIVETASTKLVHALVSTSADMIAVLPADVGLELEKLGGVRALPFPAQFSMPPVGLIAQARQWEQSHLSVLRTTLRRLVNQPAS